MCVCLNSVCVKNTSYNKQNAATTVASYQITSYNRQTEGFKCVSAARLAGWLAEIWRMDECLTKGPGLTEWLAESPICKFHANPHRNSPRHTHIHKHVSVEAFGYQMNRAVSDTHTWRVCICTVISVLYDQILVWVTWSTTSHNTITTHTCNAAS